MHVASPTEKIGMLLSFPTSVWRAPMRAVDNSVFDGDRSENEDTVAVVLHRRFELQPLNSD